MKTLLLTLLIPIALALSACGGKSTQSATEDSQTHWLSCKKNAECGDLSCVCGRCLEECSSEQSCSASGNECFSAKSEASTKLCSDDQPVAVCLAECDKDSQCPGSQVCDAGACMPAKSTDAPYDPCDGKAVCDGCSQCAPDDKDCVEGKAVKACDAQGECVFRPASCDTDAPYDPCDGKACGDSCSTCDPNDKDCAGLLIDLKCDAAGQCGGPARACGAKEPYDPCDGKACGDSCSLCAPDDKDCAETKNIKACDASGQCVNAPNAACGGEDACASLSEADCNKSAACAAYLGTPVGKDAPTFLGCGPADRVCGGALTCASKSGGLPVVFSSTCIPADFKEIAYENCDPESCASRPTDKCEDDLCALINGTHAKGEQVAAGCAGKFEACPAVITCAAPKAGGDALTFGGCIPLDWERVDAARCEASDVPCESQSAETCDQALCTVISGTDPLGAVQAVGCMSKETSCDLALTCAVSPDVNADPLFFNNGCLPEGWRSVHYAVCGEGAPESQCVDVPVADCRGACSPIVGSPIIGGPAQLPTEFGCGDADRACGDAETCASETATSQTVLFSDTCIPKGWVARPFEDCPLLE